MASRQQWRQHWWLLLAGMVVLAYGAYVVAMALNPAKPPARALAPGFAGSASCAQCHPDESRQQGGSRHAQALHEASTVESFASLPPPAWTPDPDVQQSYRITWRGRELGAEGQAGAENHWQPMHWAFGSGHQAVTFVGKTADDKYVESALSYYRRAGWDFTAGLLGRSKQIRQAEPTGHVYSAQEIYDCFNCHAVGVRQSSNGVVLQGIEQGVRCESCHGPAAAHVQAARDGHPEEGIHSLRALSGPDSVELCATCHRSTGTNSLPPNSPVLARFAPVGLKRSRCFIESKGALSCVTCHSPHTDVSTVSASYNAVCGNCHGAQSSTAQAAQVVCPRAPRGDCVSCHMPKQIIQRNCIFTDHWIRVVK